MDRSSRPALTRAETRWKAFTSRVFFVMETSRMMFCRLILAERGQKSIKSDRRSYLESSRQVPGACLHQSTMNRGNQYASWTVCRACGARRSYSSRKGATSKSKAKARGRATVSEGYPIKERTTRAVAHARSSHEEAAVNPALLDLSTAIQAMSVGFQQMSSAMRDLAQGQSQMLQMMTHAQAIPASEMNLNDLSSAAQVMVKENMDVDEELIEDHSPGGWSAASLLNPNLHNSVDHQDLGAGWFTILCYPDKTGHPRRQVIYLSIYELLGRIARQAEYDFAELITSTPSLDAARLAGLRNPPAHERLTEESGWDVFRKEHRRRFREFHARCRPSFLAVGSRETAGGQGEEEVRAKIEADFILEAVTNQVETGGSFCLRASPDSQVWKTSRWNDLASQDKSVQVFCVNENGDQVYRVATNSRWLEDGPGEEVLRDPVEVSEEGEVFHSYNLESRTELLDSEQLARTLLKQRDFSRQACLRLLRSVQQGRRHESRKESLAQSGALKYDVYGQYTHGGMSGITSRTHRSVQFSKYINEVLTRHGAYGPRSSFAATSGARLAYHRDVHNVGLNYVINLGDFTGGQVWVEEGGPDFRQVAPGKWIPGRLHSPQQQVLGFSPRKFHGPEPWQGERWSIVAYQTRSAKRLSSTHRRELRGFGFDVRGYQTQGGCDQITTQALVLDSTGISREPLPVYAQVISSEDEDQEENDEQQTSRLEQRQPSALRQLRQSPSTAEPVVSEAQASLVRKLHNNCGHPPVDRFLRTLKAAGALPHILRYVRDQFHCQDCEARRSPIPRRKAQCPRLFTFNRVVSIDTFYVRFQNASVPVLNMVCSGTNYQVVQRLDGNSDGTPTSTVTWQAFLTTWVRFLGAPQMIICDGGSEFRGQFERGIEQLGILQHVTAPECPWQNSKSERHGGWLKERLQREVNSGQCSFISLEEMDEFLASITAAKNRWFNQGGYTPVQLVFGELPRVPAELLSEDQGGLVPLCDAYHDPSGLDECGAEFRKRVQIREKACQAAMEQCSKEALVRATRSSSSQTPTWRSGQWVYVFRRGYGGAPPSNSGRPSRLKSWDINCPQMDHLGSFCNRFPHEDKHEHWTSLEKDLRVKTICYVQLLMKKTAFL
ncbi:hypothetical protein AK812_SmicGene23826 [Symbiodinium microadriaticum]|uniref:Integrase catalytic domain-containing protein n=1 Tax=Symbiodinium microadriaticum TaxID=2951 RepID=A0A1Q9DG46_SYMMI|nr:hypothetical protein AK812_SmicGene23826 [Symbiodinium microadriaticum]